MSPLPLPLGGRHLHLPLLQQALEGTAMTTSLAIHFNLSLLGQSIRALANLRLMCMVSI